MAETKTVSNKSFKEYLVEFEKQLEDIFGKKAPALPENVKEFIVKYGPFITLVMLVLALPPVIALLGFGSLASPLLALGGVSAFTGFSLAIIFLIISLVLEALALPGLFKRSITGWRYMFYATLINAVYSLLSGSLGSLIIGTAISFYFLFQIKSYYK